MSSGLDYFINEAFFINNVIPGVFSQLAARGSWLAADPCSLIKNFQDEYSNPINKRGYKNSLCRIISVCIYIKSKKDRIGKQAKSAYGCYKLVGIQKQVYEFNKTY